MLKRADFCFIKNCNGFKRNLAKIIVTMVRFVPNIEMPKERFGTVHCQFKIPRLFVRDAACKLDALSGFPDKSSYDMFTREGVVGLELIVDSKGSGPSEHEIGMVAI